MLGRYLHNCDKARLKRASCICWSLLVHREQAPGAEAPSRHKLNYGAFAPSLPQMASW